MDSAQLETGRWRREMIFRLGPPPAGFLYLLRVMMSMNTVACFALRSVEDGYFDF